MRLAHRFFRSFSFSSLSLTLQIILLNVLFFIGVYIFLFFISLRANGLSPETFMSYIAVNPSFVVKGYFWTLVTSVFVHLSFSHLLVNMFSLFFVGSFVERLIGRKRYAWFYLISGVAGSLFFVLFAYVGAFFPSTAPLFGNPFDFAVGASGAIFGLAGLLVVLLPHLKVLVFFILPMRLWSAMILLLFGLWGLSAIAGLPVGNTAHFGGLIVGLVYGLYLRLTYPHKVTLLNRLFRS